jgi:glutamate-1-semialdehyde aminotransferase
VLASVAGHVTVEHLTKASNDRIDAQADRLNDVLEAEAKSLGVPLYLLNEGPVMGMYFTETKPRPGSDLPNPDLVARFHLACLNNGVQN